MNTSFNVLDNTNNLQKRADIIVKFSYENKEYLIYSIDENNLNKQIFVSRFILNTEGKYFIEDILPEEKEKLNNIVYNIVIVLPSDYEKGKDAKELIEEFSTKNLVKLSKNIPELSNQEYYSSCSVAITSSTLVNNAISFYQEHLMDEESSQNKDILIWTVPIEETASTTIPVDSNLEVNHNENSNNVDRNNVEEQIPNSNINFNNDASAPNINIINDETNNTLNQVSDFNSTSQLPNPQAEILTAVNSDPSLSEATGIGTQTKMQPNLGKQKKAGFAINKYIITGTVCLLLAVVVVIVAYILIKNK